MKVRIKLEKVEYQVFLRKGQIVIEERKRENGEA